MGIDYYIDSSFRPITVCRFLVNEMLMIPFHGLFELQERRFGIIIIMVVAAISLEALGLRESCYPMFVSRFIGQSIFHIFVKHLQESN